MEYLTLAFVGFIAALTPGPDIFYVIRNGLCKGKKASFLAVLGILTGNLVYLTLVGLGLGIIGENKYFQLIVGILGGIYLIKISYLIFNEKVIIDKSCDSLRSFDIYKQALFLNLSNPKAMIFFAVIVTPFMSKNIMLSLLVLFTGIATAFILAATISSKITLEEKIMIIINKISSIIFFIFAIKLFLIAYESFKDIFI